MIVAGTGHRPNKLGGYGDDIYQKLVTLAMTYLEETRPKRVISGMALGWDQALAEAAVNRNIKFTAAIPFEGQENKWYPSSVVNYNKLLGLADRIYIVSEGGYSVYKLFLRNEWMVNNADRVVALWNGTSGGTTGTISYAKQVGIPIDNLWDKWNVVSV
tara:strand:+ start:530 stop:1006 length:477 start_codon:yes stop_codon:yes gene_type:complete